MIFAFWNSAAIQLTVFPAMSFVRPASSATLCPVSCFTVCTSSSKEVIAATFRTIVPLGAVRPGAPDLYCAASAPSATAAAFMSLSLCTSTTLRPGANTWATRVAISARFSMSICRPCFIWLIFSAPF